MMRFIVQHSYLLVPKPFFLIFFFPVVLDLTYFVSAIGACVCARI